MNRDLEVRLSTVLERMAPERRGKDLMLWLPREGKSTLFLRVVRLKSIAGLFR